MERAPLSSRGTLIVNLVLIKSYTLGADISEGQVFTDIWGHSDVTVVKGLPDVGLNVAYTFDCMICFPMESPSAYVPMCYHS